jgi:gamma-glutamylcyclotransferase (GGCT)/AIG2-like uncharacterized protein YtfP
MLHFAYGANMSRAVMRRYAPTAKPLGTAELGGYRFIISADGYASVVPASARTVHGVLWRIAPRDRVLLDAWENVMGGLYRAETLAVRHGGGRAVALVYVARTGEGRPKPGYMELVVEAAREWELPSGYIIGLESWLPARSGGVDARKIGAFR